MSLEQSTLGWRKLLSRQDFRENYAYQGNAERALEVLDTHRVFSCYHWAKNAYISYTSPKLPALNILGLYVQYTGSLKAVFGIQGKPISFQAGIVFPQEKLTALRMYWKKELGLTLHKVSDKRYSFSAHGNTYARMLHLLGYSTSMESPDTYRNSKAARGARLPKYLSTLVKEFDSFNDKSKLVARRYLTDLVSVICDTSTILQNSHSAVRIRMQSQREEEIAREESLTLLGAMNLAYPRLGASMKNNFSCVHSELNYDGYLNFPFEQIIAASSTSQVFPIRFRQVVEPRFSGF